MAEAALAREADIDPLPRAIPFDGEVMRIHKTAGQRDALQGATRPGPTGMHCAHAARQPAAAARPTWKSGAERTA